MTETREEANTIVTLVRDRDLAQTIRSIYGAERARSIQKSLEPQCLSSFKQGRQLPHRARQRHPGGGCRRLHFLRLRL